MQPQLPTVAGEQVGDFMLLEMSPEVFDRIELGGVRGEALEPQPAGACGEECLDGLAAVNRGSVPDHQELARDVAHQRLQELGRPYSIDAAFVDPEEKLPQGDPRDQREFFPVERLLQHWRAAAGSPGAHPVGPRAQSAFVDEDDRAVFAPRFFFRFGQPCFVHASMASSSRSIARRVGC